MHFYAEVLRQNGETKRMHARDWLRVVGWAEGQRQVYGAERVIIGVTVEFENTRERLEEMGVVLRLLPKEG